MILVFDLFRENGQITLAAKTLPSVGVTFPCYTPWKTLTLADEVEEKSFSDFLQKVLAFLQAEYRESVEYAIFIIPWDFSYRKKIKIQKLVSQIGISRMSYRYSVECEALLYARETGKTFYFQFEEDRVEFGVDESEDSVVEMLGFCGLRRAPNESDVDFQGRLDAEIRQFMTDTELAWDAIERLVIFGSADTPIVKWAEKLSGKSAIQRRSEASKGAFLHYQIRRQQTEGALLLQAIPFDLSLALGENGERGIAVKRYTCYPVQKALLLQVSTEPMLHIYEGNYFNPQYDTLLGSVPLDFVPEGHEAECILDVDAYGNIRLTVKNDKQETLVDCYVHELK